MFSNNNLKLPAAYASLVPIGKIEKTLLENLAAILNLKFKFKFIIQKNTHVPADAENTRRRQYLSTPILNRLNRFRGTKVLGVIDKDLYNTGLNYIFGQAEFPGRSAVIAIKRLRPEFYGEMPDNELFFERVVKEAVHEIGHTCGLGHCGNKECVMCFSNSIADTDIKKSSFCDKCLSKIEKRSWI